MLWKLQVPEDFIHFQLNFSYLSALAYNLWPLASDKLTFVYFLLTQVCFMIIGQFEFESRTDASNNPQGQRW